MAATANERRDRHAEIPDRVYLLSSLLDDAVRVPGTGFRIGIDPIVGVIPGLGDSVMSVLSLYLIAEAYRLGAPKRLLAKMLAVLALDTVVGSIPLLGTLFDATWKANRRNVRLLERHLTERSR